MDNSHNEMMIRQEAMSTEFMKQTFIAVAELKPTLSKDGDAWCYLLGDDVQSGIAGFGKTPHQAMIDFNKEFGCLG